MNGRRIAFGVCLLAMLAASPTVQAQRKSGERVSIIGCPYAGVTSNCLMIKGADDTVYNITAAAPRPRVGGRVIRLRGTVSGKPSVCGEGIVLERIRWTRTRQHCPK
jgi:hypothetical protein